MQPRLLLPTATVLLLAGCNSPPGAGADPVLATGDGPDSPSPILWQISNSTVLSLISGLGGGDWTPASCSRADFRIPTGTWFVEAKIAQPPNVNPAQPGVGQLGVLLRAPNETRIDSHYQVGILDPPPGRWTVQIYGDPIVVNQYATVTVTLRGAGNATGTQELVFWKDPVQPPWDAAGGCPGPE